MEGGSRRRRSLKRRERGRRLKLPYRRGGGIVNGQSRPRRRAVDRQRLPDMLISLRLKLWRVDWRAVALRGTLRMDGRSIAWRDRRVLGRARDGGAFFMTAKMRIEQIADGK
jgi:hypothetical protein